MELYIVNGRGTTHLTMRQLVNSPHYFADIRHGHVFFADTHEVVTGSDVADWIDDMGMMEYEARRVFNSTTSDATWNEFLQQLADNHSITRWQAEFWAR